MVVGQNGQPGAAREAAFSDPTTHGFGHPAHFCIRATLDVVVALNLQRNIVRPALGAFDKTVVERGHGSWGIYTKSVSGGAVGQVGKKLKVFSVAFLLPLRPYEIAPPPGHLAHARRLSPNSATRAKSRADT